jgi:hypothetical protein
MGKGHYSPQEAFVHTAFTLPSARGKGFASVLLNEMFLYLKKNQFRRVHGFIVSDNEKSVDSFIGPLNCSVARRRALYFRFLNREKYFLYEK